MNQSVREVGEEELLIAFKSNSSSEVEEVLLVLNSARDALFNLKLVAEVDCEYLRLVDLKQDRERKVVTDLLRERQSCSAAGEKVYLVDVIPLEELV